VEISTPIDNRPDSWYACKDCRSIHPTEAAADKCCEGRHSRESKDVDKIMRRKFGI